MSLRQQASPVAKPKTVAANIYYIELVKLSFTNLVSRLLQQNGSLSLIS